MVSDGLPEWLAIELDEASGPGGIADVGYVRALLVGCAQQGTSISYSALLARLGHRFTRPKMRALCRTLDAIDTRGPVAGEPELAALVVRESDGLPGQGWWSARAARGYSGVWTGDEAARFVLDEQEKAFRFWRPTG